MQGDKKACEQQMIPSARDRKAEHYAILQNYKIKAREYAWLLKKDGYIIEFFNRHKIKSNRAKLDYYIINSFEIIRIYECHDGIWETIIKDLDYKKFFRFFALVQRYKRSYGKKKLHEYTGEIIRELRI